MVLIGTATGAVRRGGKRARGGGGHAVDRPVCVVTGQAETQSRAPPSAVTVVVVSVKASKRASGAESKQGWSVWAGLGWAARRFQAGDMVLACDACLSPVEMRRS